MRAAPAITLPILLLGCDSAAHEPTVRAAGAEATSAITIERSQVLPDTFYSIGAVEGSSTARLVLVCGGTRPSIQIYSGMPPDRPPPLRGVYGSIAIDDRPAGQVELSWLTGDGWTIRDDAEESALVAAITTAKQVRLSAPLESLPAGDLGWRIGPGPKRDAMRELCSD